MAAPAWEDLDVFLQLDDFAISAVIHLQSGSTRQVAGIFDDPYLGAALGGYDRDDMNPTLTVKESDAVGIKRGDYVVIAGQNYDVLTGAQGDGTGMSVIKLNKA